MTMHQLVSTWMFRYEFDNFLIRLNVEFSYLCFTIYYNIST